MRLSESEIETKYSKSKVSAGCDQNSPTDADDLLDADSAATASSENKISDPTASLLDITQEGETQPGTGGFLPVLKNRNFLALWSGQVFSQLADKVYLVLMIAIIASRFQSENQTISGWVSAIMMAFTIPAVLFGSVAGVFVN